MIKDIKGDLLELDVDIIAHQTNCQGVMGSGIALQIKQKYFNVYINYNKLCKLKTPEALMGKCQIVATDSTNNKYVANLFGQNRFGKGLQTDYKALEDALYELKSFAKNNSLSVGIPYNVGCGLAGGDWNIVRKIIEEVFNDYEITICQL